MGEVAVAGERAGGRAGDRAHPLQLKRPRLVQDRRVFQVDPATFGELTSRGGQRDVRPDAALHRATAVAQVGVENVGESVRAPLGGPARVWTAVLGRTWTAQRRQRGVQLLRRLHIEITPQHGAPVAAPTQLQAIAGDIFGGGGI